MPTYDYLCGNCEDTFEKFQSITARPLRKCPKCGKMKLQRLIGTGAGIIFKGNGFYETDYRSETYKKEAKEDKPSSSKEKKGKKDSKADAKKETASAKSDSSNKTSKKTA